MSVNGSVPSSIYICPIIYFFTPPVKYITMKTYYTLMSFFNLKYIVLTISIRRKGIWYFKPRSTYAYSKRRFLQILYSIFTINKTDTQLYGKRPTLIKSIFCICIVSYEKRSFGIFAIKETPFLYRSIPPVITRI